MKISGAILELNRLPSVLTTGKLNTTSMTAKEKAEGLIKALGSDTAVMTELMRMQKEGS